MGVERKRTLAWSTSMSNWFILAFVMWVIACAEIPPVVEGNHKQAKRKLHDVAGSICIDCGIPEGSHYTDATTEIEYTSDARFINSGVNKDISSKYISETLQKAFTNVRSFPQGNRNCYTLRPPEGRNTIYMIRALFMYGDYDGLAKPPQFDLYIGVNKWDSVKFDNDTHVVMQEILHVPSTDNIDICLLNTGSGTPFISALELRHLHHSTYKTTYGSLVLYRRFDVGSTNGQIIRYKEDTFDRMWFPYDIPNTMKINTSLTIDSIGDINNYTLPSSVMSTAVKPINVNDSLEFEFNIGDPTLEFYVYLHFAEVEEHEDDGLREFNIILNGNVWAESVVPDYLSSTTMFSTKPVRGANLKFSLNKISNSTLPPILNALEIYIVSILWQAPTDSQDVDAIMDIKTRYKVVEIWQGDPCGPASYSWSGLNCSYNGYDPPKIISLNLSSSKLEGNIYLSFSKLSSLQHLDLSNNSLTGRLPEFLAEMPFLRTINVSGNRLSGSIPTLLKEKSKNGSLLLSVESNPDICITEPCEENNNNGSNNSTPIIAGVVSSTFVLILLCFIFIITWRHKRKPVAKQDVRSFEGSSLFKSNKQKYSYSEIISITNNFQTIIGKGGFGTVYHGFLSDGDQVAVKMLSPTQTKSSEQFQNEAQLLMRVHHRNLTAFLGYCNENERIGIIYEYMAYGNLEEYLSDAKKGKQSWKQRLQIAIDAAQGLEYLHHGCKPPIIHRDIKPANILLDEQMQAKIADFGFSKNFPSGSHVSTTVVGTLGYLDPEYYSSSRLTEKSDIFSFGVVLLELITGKPAIKKGYENTHIVNWVTSCLARGDLEQVVDLRLQGDFDAASVWRAVEVAIACVPSMSIQRPPMSYVVTELKECLEMEAAREQTSQVITKSNSINNVSVVSGEDELGPEAR